MKLNAWIHHTLIGFGIFNIMIGLTLFFWYPQVQLTVVSPFIPQGVWGTVFLISGLVILWGLYIHNLKLLWYTMVFGLFIKAMWEIGLVFRLNNGGTPLVPEVWGMLAYLQFLAVIFFKPDSYYE